MYIYHLKYRKKPIDLVKVNHMNYISTTWGRSLPFLMSVITFLSQYNKVLCMYQSWQMDREKYNPTWCHGFSMLPSHFQICQKKHLVKHILKNWRNTLHIWFLCWEVLLSDVIMYYFLHIIFLNFCILKLFFLFQSKK